MNDLLDAFLDRQPNQRECVTNSAIIVNCIILSVASILLQLVSWHELKLKVIAEPFDCLSICSRTWSKLMRANIYGFLRFLCGCISSGRVKNEWSNLKPTETYLSIAYDKGQRDKDGSGMVIRRKYTALVTESLLWTWLDFVWLSEAGRQAGLRPSDRRFVWAILIGTINFAESSFFGDDWRLIELKPEIVACQRNSWSMVIAAKST